MKTPPCRRQTLPLTTTLLLNLILVTAAAALLSCQPQQQNSQQLTPQQIEYLQSRDPYRTPAVHDEPAPLSTPVPQQAEPLRPPWPVLPRPKDFQRCAYPAQDFIPAIRSCIGRRS